VDVHMWGVGLSRWVYTDQVMDIHRVSVRLEAQIISRSSKSGNAEN